MKDSSITGDDEFIASSTVDSLSALGRYVDGATPPMTRFVRAISGVLLTMLFHFDLSRPLFMQYACGNMWWMSGGVMLAFTAVMSSPSMKSLAPWRKTSAMTPL